MVWQVSEPKGAEKRVVPRLHFWISSIFRFTPLSCDGMIEGEGGGSATGAERGQLSRFTLGYRLSFIF